MTGREPNDVSERLVEAYKFLGILKVKSLPFWGRISTYNGGGYVADIGRSAYSVSSTNFLSNIILFVIHSNTLKITIKLLRDLISSGVISALNFL